MGEFELIDMLASRLGEPSGSVEVGIGDDAAVVAFGGGRRLALTTDAMVEGVHFRLDRGTPRQLGRRALAVNLSDLAAMGAEPRFAVVALGVPRELDRAVLGAIYDGLAEIAAEHRVVIVGGNVSGSPVLSLTVTLVGDLDGPALLRSQGNPGDRLVVTGEVGSSALGRMLLDEARRDLDEDEVALVARHLDPTPRVEAGRALRLIATAGIDLSDGLAQDAGHLAKASRCGARIECARLPLSPAYERLTSGLDDPWAPALAGGEDYELLLAVPPLALRNARLTAATAGVELHEVGELVVGDEVRVVDPDGRDRPAPAGWDHL